MMIHDYREVLNLMIIVGEVVFMVLLFRWSFRMDAKRLRKRKEAHEAERERLYAKIRDFPELGKEIYQSIEDQEARFRREKKKVVKQVVIQGQPVEADKQTPMQLFKAAFLSIFK